MLEKPTLSPVARKPKTRKWVKLRSNGCVAQGLLSLAPLSIAERGIKKKSKKAVKPSVILSQNPKAQLKGVLSVSTTNKTTIPTISAFLFQSLF